MAEVTFPAGLFLGGAAAIGITSIGIAILDHKAASERGEAITQKTELRPFDYVVLAGAIFYFAYESVELLGEYGALKKAEELSKHLL